MGARTRGTGDPELGDVGETTHARRTGGGALLLEFLEDVGLAGHGRRTLTSGVPPVVDRRQVSVRLRRNSLRRVLSSGGKINML
jgi:hypothetical protein